MTTQKFTVATGNGGGGASSGSEIRLGIYSSVVTHCRRVVSLRRNVPLIPLMLLKPDNFRSIVGGISLTWAGIH